MTNKEAIWIINNRLNTYYCTDNDLKALDKAIEALKTVDKIKQVIDKHDFPEYLEEDVIDIIEAYYKEVDNEDKT